MISVKMHSPVKFAALRCRGTASGLWGYKIMGLNPAAQSCQLRDLDTALIEPDLYRFSGQLRRYFLDHPVMAGNRHQFSTKLAKENAAGEVAKGAGQGATAQWRGDMRSEERRGGKECDRTCRYRGRPDHL